MQTSTQKIIVTTMSLDRREVENAILHSLGLPADKVDSTFDFVIQADASVDQLDVRGLNVVIKSVENESTQPLFDMPREVAASEAKESSAAVPVGDNPPAGQQPPDFPNEKEWICNGGLYLSTWYTAGESDRHYRFQLRYLADKAQQVEAGGIDKDESSTLLAAIVHIRTAIERSLKPERTNEKRFLNNANQALAALEVKVAKMFNVPPPGTKKSTAKKGNPSEASRGAAVTRELNAISDGINQRLWDLKLYNDKPNVDAVLTLITPGIVNPAEAMKSATLAELSAAKARLIAATEDDIRYAVRVGSAAVHQHAMTQIALESPAPSGADACDAQSNLEPTQSQPEPAGTA